GRVSDRSWPSRPQPAWPRAGPPPRPTGARRRRIPLRPRPTAAASPAGCARPGGGGIPRGAWFRQPSYHTAGPTATGGSGSPVRDPNLAKAGRRGRRLLPPLNEERHNGHEVLAIRPHAVGLVRAPAPRLGHTNSV